MSKKEKYELGNMNILTRNGQKVAAFGDLDDLADAVRKVVNDHNRLQRTLDRMADHYDEGDIDSIHMMVRNYANLTRHG